MAKTKRIIRLVLKEKGESDKDTKEGEKKTYKNVFVGSMNEIEVKLTLKSESRELLNGAEGPKLGEELFIEIVDNPQTTLNDHAEEPQKEEKKGETKKKRQKKGEEEKTKIIDAEFRLADEQKKIGPGSDENILSEITA